MLLKAFIDRGQRPDAAGIMSIGCAVFAEAPYKKFARAWRTHRRALGGVPYIHATDFYGGADIYAAVPPAKRSEVAALLPYTIRSHVKAHTVVAFKADEFKVVAGDVWKARFGSLYTTAVQLAMGAIGHWAKFTQYKGRISYFYEDGDREGPELAKTLASMPEALRKHTRMLTHAPKAKGAACGLEVADVLAWHWNKFYAETIARDGLREERRARKDFQALFGDDVEGPAPRVFLYTGKELEDALKYLWNPEFPPRHELHRASIWNDIRAHLGTGPARPIHRRPWT